MSDVTKELKVIFENISELSARRDLVLEESDICFSLLAEYLTKNTDLISSKNEIFELIRKYCANANASQCMSFLREITRNLSFPDSFLSLAEDNFEIFSKDKPAVISYVKNNYNDAAYLRFSELFSNAKVSYGASFDDICENVYNGISDYCILPIESVDAGKLFSFYSLIDKYDLKIFAVSDIDEGHTEKRTRYALLSRGNLIFSQQVEKAYFEFSVIHDDSYDLTDILNAAKACSLGLYRIDTIPVYYDDLAFKFYHVFELSGNDLIPFLIYIELRYPQFKPLGYYILV